jgi:hypothetical protein
LWLTEKLVGEYMCKVYINEVLHGDVHTIAVTERVIERVKFDVQGLNWYGPTTTVDKRSGSFEVIAIGGEKLELGDFSVDVRSDSELPAGAWSIGYGVSPESPSKYKVTFTITVACM